MSNNPEQPIEDYEYTTSVECNIAIMREISRIHFRERLERVMPLVAKNLVAAGVDFSRVDWSRVIDPTEAEMDAVFEDLH